MLGTESVILKQGDLMTERWFGTEPLQDLFELKLFCVSVILKIQVPCILCSSCAFISLLCCSCRSPPCSETDDERDAECTFLLMYKELKRGKKSLSVILKVRCNCSMRYLSPKMCSYQCVAASLLEPQAPQGWS